MTNSVAKFFLFLIAYVPIYFIAGLKSIDPNFYYECGDRMPISTIFWNNKFPIILFLLGIILILYFIYLSKTILNPKGTPLLTISEIKPFRKEYVTYLGTYILPFIGFSSNSVFDIIALILMFITIGLIYIKTDLIFTNPTLSLFGFDLFEVKDENDKNYIALAKDKLEKGDRPKGKKLSHNTLILKK